MKTSTTAAILLAAPMMAEAFMPSAGLAAAPSLRGGQQRASAASSISRIGMQAKDSSEGQSVSRRDTLGLLSLAPFVAAGLAMGKAAPAEAKFLPIEELMVSHRRPSTVFVAHLGDPSLVQKPMKVSFHSATPFAPPHVTFIPL